MPDPRLTRKERKRQTRAAVLRAAAELFAANGLEGTSVEAIAREAGLTQGAIYSNFASKADLWWAVVEEASRLIPFEQYLTGEEPLGAELAALGRAVWSLLRSTSRTDLLLAQEFDLFLMRNPRERARHSRVMRTGRRELASLLERTSTRRGEPLPAPAAQLAMSIDAVTEGLLHLFMLDGNAVNEQLCVTTLTALAPQG